MENNVRRMLADIGQLLDVAEYDTKNYADREGGLRDNTIRDQPNSPHYSKAESNNCFSIHSQYFQLQQNLLTSIYRKIFFCF